MSVCSISLFLPPYLPGRWVRNYVAPSLALARRSLWSWEASLPLWCLTLLTWTALWREWWTPSSSTRARSDTRHVVVLVFTVRLCILTCLFKHQPIGLMKNMYIMGSSPTRGSSFFLGKVTALGVLCCFALLFV